MWTFKRAANRRPSTDRQSNPAVCRALAIACLSGLAAAPASAQTSLNTTVTVDTGTVLRPLPARHHMGHNFTFKELAFDSFDVDAGALHPQVYEALREARPGLLRFPAGNQSYGYHFELARQGIAHEIKGPVLQMDFGPQHLLQLVDRLRTDGVEVDLLVHLSPVWGSPEEAAAFVAYLIGDPADTRSIGTDGPDYSGRDWQTVGHWAGLRQNTDMRNAYAGTLYYQVGNEEWLGWRTNSGSNTRSGWVDAYGLHRTQRLPIRQDPQTAGCNSSNVRDLVKFSYLDVYSATYQKLKSLFGDAVQVGAMGIRSTHRDSPNELTYRSGADSQCGFPDGWNESLLARLASDPDTGADFIGSVHLYNHDLKGWDLHNSAQGSHNLLGVSDQFKVRVGEFNSLSEQVTGRSLADLVGPGAIWVTEFNAHQNPSAVNPAIPQSSLVQALYNLDLIASSMQNPDVGALMRWQAVRSDVEGNGKYEYALLHTPHPNDGSNGAPDGEVGHSGPFYAYAMLGELHKTVLQTTVESCAGCDWTPNAGTSWYTARPLPFVSTVATLSPDGQELAVLLINKNTTADLQVDLTMLDFLPADIHDRTVLDVSFDNGHSSIFTENLLGQVEWVGFTQDAVPTTGACDEMTVTLPNHSATLLVFTRDGTNTCSPPPPPPPPPFEVLMETAFDNFGGWFESGRGKWFNRDMHDTTGYDFAGGSGNKVAEALGGGFYGPSLLTSNTVDTRGHTELIIDFQRYLADTFSDPTLDFLKFEVKASNGWQTIRRWGPGAGADGSWHDESITLTAADGNLFWSGFRVRFSYRGGGGVDYAGVDDVTVSAR